MFLRRGAIFDDTVPERSFTGGMRYGNFGVANWTYPLVRLDMYESGLELRATYRFLSWLVPVWRARYDEISAVGWLERPTPDSSAALGLVKTGVLFTPVDGNWVIFWCHQRNQVLDALARHGLRIDTARKRLTIFGPV